MLCLHCGNSYSFKRESYCEDCYQKLVAENLKLQIRVKELEEKLGCEHKPKHMKEENRCIYDNYDNLLEHIPRIECNFKEGE